MVKVAGTTMQQFVKAIKGGAVKEGTKMPALSKGGKPINIKCVEKQGDCYVLEKTVQNGDREITGRFTYLNGKLQPHIVTEASPRGTITHKRSAGHFCTPYGNVREVGKVKLAEADGTFAYDGRISAPEMVTWNNGRPMQAADTIIPTENFKNVVNYIRNASAANAYKA